MRISDWCYVLPWLDFEVAVEASRWHCQLLVAPKVVQASELLGKLCFFFFNRIVGPKSLTLDSIDLEWSSEDEWGRGSSAIELPTCCIAFSW